MRGSYKTSKTHFKPELQKLFAILVFNFFALAVFSGARAETNPYSLCKLNQEVRTLRVVDKDDGKCRTIYNKYGKDQSVGEAQYQSSCESILGKVQTTLENAGWKCKSVKNSGVSDLTTGVQ